MEYTVAVLMGGRSAEREISLITGKKIIKTLEELGYEVIGIDAANHFWNRLEEVKPDVVFIALHGKWGEDGTVQGMLDVMGIEYIGSGVLASALSMDKVLSKKIFERESIPTPDYAVVLKDEKYDVGEIEKMVGLPAIVKPATEGSAIGIHIAKSADDLKTNIEKAFQIDEKIVVERFIAGPEITIGILGNEPAIALPAIEILSSNDFYDYEAKYEVGKSRHLIPPDLPNDILDECKQAALKIHKVIGCRDMSRIDIKISHEMEYYVLEVNTIPGMTETSLFPEAALAAGYDFKKLIDTLISFGLNRRKSDNAGNRFVDSQMVN